ncbi:MAG: hypothetical protein ACREN6_05040 [Gemmatimonadaceae bacterium]
MALAAENGAESMRGASLVMFALLCLCACAGDVPTRLTAASDTLTVDGRRLVSLPFVATGSTGQPIAHPRLTFSTTSRIVHISRKNQVWCVTAGNATIIASYRDLNARVVVQCRPIRVFARIGYDEPLWVGAAPRPVLVQVQAVDSVGRPVENLRGTVSAAVRDDSVARIIGGRVYALSRGETRIDLEFAGVQNRGGGSIKVVERTVHETTRLVGGQWKSWRLAPGYYELRLDSLNDPHKPAGLELATYNANCARAPHDDGQHYFCILTARSSIIVRNPHSAGATREMFGELTAYRQP